MESVDQVTGTQNPAYLIQQTPDWSGSSKIIWGFRAAVVTLRMRLHILAVAIRVYRNLLTAVKVLYDLIMEKKRVLGDSFSTRYVKADNRYYWSFMVSGWPSPSFTKFIENELMRARPFGGRTNHLQILIIAITSKCGLSCEHCFEWDNLDSKEALEVAQLKQVIHDFQDRGVSQVQLSGGEPLNRFDDILDLLRSAKPATDFWLITSGFGFTLNKAQQLKQAGLTGVTLSLDHWDEEGHNRFRRNDKSFYWVREAVLNCHHAELTVSLSLCATKEFVSQDNLWKYLRLAKRMGVNFVRILEPRQVGRYADKEVELAENQLKILQEFYLKVNSDSRYRSWPIVLYPGYHQRNYGCFGAGDRFLYVDSKGEMHACPFCHTSAGDVFSTPLDVLIERMQSRSSCLQFKQFG